MTSDDRAGESRPLLPGPNKMVDYDAALGYIGSFGTYQKIKFVLLLLLCIPVGIHMLAMPFLAAKVSHHCAVPELAEAGLAPNDTCGLNFSLPWVTDKDDNTETPSECKRYSVNRYELGNLSCPFERNNSEANRTVLDCDKGWWYDRRVYNSSVYMEFNLVCEDEPLNNLAQSLFMVGVLIGSIVFGQLSDSIGRKKTMYLAVLLQLGFGVATAFAPNYEVFVVLRLLVGFTAMGVFLPAFVIATEMVGVDRRTLTGTLIQSSFSAGGVVLTGIAYLIRDWSRLQLVISLINVVLVLTWWFGIESPRWQLSKGRNEEVVRMIRRAAKVNGVTVPEEVFHAGRKQITDDKRQYNIFDIVRTPNMAKKSVIIFLNWFVVTVVWFGLALNTAQLGGDNYLNFLIMNLVDFPAQLFSIFTVSYFGRRPSLTFFMLFGGVACIVTPYLSPPFLPKYLHPLSVTLPMIGKFGNTAAFSVIYVWTAELYPTVVRNVGVGASSMWSRVGGIASPFVMLSEQVWEPLPYLIFGGLSVVAGLAALLLPETRGVRLPDTLEEGENFGKRTPYKGYRPVPAEEKVPETTCSNPGLRHDDETVKEDPEAVLTDNKAAIQCSEDC